MESENSLAELKSKSLTGMKSLVRRQIIIKIVNFLSGVILARLLAPEIFGVYAIVAFIIQFFSTFGDVGIGAALIQKKGNLSKNELSTTFWLQQLIVLLLVILVLITAPLVLKVYPKLDTSVVWLVRAMAFSLMLTSLKTVPAILMERHLAFDRIAWVDIAETLVYQVAVISMALMGLNVWSFIVATLIRGLVGVGLIFCLSSWRPSLNFEPASIRELVRFGLPYQGNTVLAFIKDAVTPVFVGAYIGAAAVGYLNWARSLAFAPLMVSESFGRVAFPAFAKLQNNRELLGNVVDKSVKMITLVMFPITAIMIALGPDIVKIVFTNKWMPGLWAYYFFCTTPIAIGIVLPMYSAILALGKSTILLKMTFVLMLVEWATGITFTLKFGFTGIAMSQPITTVLFFFVYKKVLKNEGVTLKFFQNIRVSLVSSIIMGILIKIISLQINVGVMSLIAITIVGILGFISLVSFANRDMLTDFKGYIAKAGGLK